MRIRPWVILLLGLVAVPRSLAFDPAPLPTVENTAGAWVAASRDCTHYRLVLDGHGMGSFGFKANGVAVQTYVVVAVEIDHYDIRIRLRSADPKEPELVLQGDGTPRYLTLRSKSFFYKDTLKFVSDAEWRENEDALRSVLPVPAP
jgi:hypothetical protein